MPDMKTLIEKKSSFISRQFGDLKLYIKEKLEKYNTAKLLIDVEVELACKIRRINMLLICLLLINIIILLLLIFRG